MNVLGWRGRTGRAASAAAKMRRAGRWRRGAAFVFLAAGASLAAGAGMALAGPRPEPSKTLTIARIYSAPSLSGSLVRGVEWAPDGTRISYFENKGHATDLCTREVRTGHRRVLLKEETLAAAMPPAETSAVQSTGLGRVEAPDYLWSPHGDALLLIGGSRLVLLSLATKTPRTLASSGPADALADPKFSPDGNWVSFVRDANLWLVNVASGETKQLTFGGGAGVRDGQLDWLYPEELDASTAYWWSPDSSQIAFYEMDERPVARYPILDMSSLAGAIEYTRFPLAGAANPIVHVGVIAIGASGPAGPPRWMDTGADPDVYLPRVVWLRNSRRVAVERLNRAQNRLDLLFCEAATGASQTVLTETDPYWINLADDLYFFSDNRRFLWSSERTGFRHYYLYDLSGKLLGPLTQGAWGILGNGGFGPGAASHPAVDEAHGFIYFLSNKDEVVGTQLYRVSLRDQSVARITAEPGTHDPLIAPDASAFVDTYSNAMTPPRQSLRRMDGSRIVFLTGENARALGPYHLSPVEFLNVTAEDGTELYASLIRPARFDAAKRYPVLINVYGGPQDQNVRNAWGGADFLWLEMMAEKGYLIFTLDNRGSWGRGHAFEIPLFHRLGKVELADQLAGVNYLKSLPYVDGSRIGMWGWSYGGTMTLDALFNAPNVFRAGAAVAPVSDWRLYDTAYTERYLGRPQDNPAGYEESSPVNQAAGLRGKLLLAQGTGDDNVHFANTSEVINKLILVGRYPDELAIFPGRGHSLNDPAARIVLFRKITAFFLHDL